MKQFVILGAGTGGTLMANKLRSKLPLNEWDITIIDQDSRHLYQPGYLFIPFGIYEAEDIIKPKSRFIPKNVHFILDEIVGIDTTSQRIDLKNKAAISYDYLLIATGVNPNPNETDGLTDEGWYQSAFDFYTLEGAIALHKKLSAMTEGKLVINVVENPIKCPVAPLEFAFLADAYFTKKGNRKNIEIEYVTPLDGAFTKPVAKKELGYLLEERNINIIPNFNTGSVDYSTNSIQSWDNKSVNFDLMVNVPVNMGSQFLGESGIGDELNFVPTNPKTLISKEFENIFAIGDVTDLPTSKAGSVVHFQAGILTENILSVINGKDPKAEFDGHANCFIETGYGKALLIDFNYKVEPLSGDFPFPFFGPMSLLKESRLNHWGKMAFKWVYYHMLITGKPLPFPDKFSMIGKKQISLM